MNTGKVKEIGDNWHSKGANIKKDILQVECGMKWDVERCGGQQGCREEGVKAEEEKRLQQLRKCGLGLRGKQKLEEAWWTLELAPKDG